MRLWSLHPKYLDTRGLVAVWREGLLARKVLLGETVGYRNHPQLFRFHNQNSPIGTIDFYLKAIYIEAAKRGYCFNRNKISVAPVSLTLKVTSGQLRYEWVHLIEKLRQRDPARLELLQQRKIDIPVPHPLFMVVQGDIEQWEKVIPGKD